MRNVVCGSVYTGDEFSQGHPLILLVNKESVGVCLVDMNHIEEQDVLVNCGIDYSNKLVVDVGCGAGDNVPLFLKIGASDSLGVDFESCIHHPREKYPHLAEKFLIGSATALPFEDSSIDVIVMQKLFGKVVESISEVERVLRPGGYFAILENGGGTYWHLFSPPDGGIFDGSWVEPVRQIVHEGHGTLKQAEGIDDQDFVFYRDLAYYKCECEENLMEEDLTEYIEPGVLHAEKLALEKGVSVDELKFTYEFYLAVMQKQETKSMDHV